MKTARYSAETVRKDDKRLVGKRIVRVLPNQFGFTLVLQGGQQIHATDIKPKA